MADKAGTERDAEERDGNPEEEGEESILNRRRASVLGILFVILALLAVFWVLGASPTPDEEPVSPSEKNTELFYTLADASITDAVVDITDERALVRYNVPENMTKNESVYYTLGATARVANESERVVLEVFSENEPVERVEVRVEEVESYLSDETTLSDLEKEIERTDIGQS